MPVYQLSRPARTGVVFVKQTSILVEIKVTFQVAGGAHDGARSAHGAHKVRHSAAGLLPNLWARPRIVRQRIV